jgi:PIN domain nuclease of toxin-antitoxin system
MAQNILLDTCTFLWVIRDSPELSPVARSLFIDPENTVVGARLKLTTCAR